MKMRRAKSCSMMGSLLALLLAAGQTLWAGPPTADQLQKVTAALPARAQVAPLRPRKLLVFTRTTGYRHSSIELGAEAIRLMGEKTGAYTATASDDIAMFEPAALQQFDAVLLLSTTDEPLKTPVAANASDADKQAAADRDKRVKASLLAFVRGGKGLAGIHAATDAYWKPDQAWPEYEDMIGGAFDGHPWNEKVGVVVEDKNSPLARGFNGHDFDIADEIYQFKTPPYARDNRRVLLALDLARTPKKGGMNRKDNDYAVAWIKSYGQGHVYYCSLGHREEIYWNPAMLQFYLNGLQFAFGDLKADVTSLPQPIRPIAAADLAPGAVINAGGAAGATVAVVNGAAPGAAISGPPADIVDPIMGEYYMGAATTYQEVNKATISGDGDGDYRVAVTLPPLAGQDRPRRVELTGKANDNGGLDATGRLLDTPWTSSLQNGLLTVTEQGAAPLVFHRVNRHSPTEGLRPPAGAIVLLPYVPGQPPSLTELTNKDWPVYTDGSTASDKSDSETTRQFGDIRFHGEFRVPYEAKERGQGRGNSGFGFINRYEFQILDSFGLVPNKGDVGAIYDTIAPTTNSSLPPLQWESYDIVFHAAKMGADGKVVQLPRATVYLNGVLVQDNREIPQGTGIGPREHAARGPLKLQYHHHPVRFCNIWVVELPDNDNMAAERAVAQSVTRISVPPGATVSPPLLNRTGIAAIGGADGWKTLFNGKDLTGWKAKDDKVEVVDGAIHIPQGAGDIWTTDSYGDFIFDLEFKNEKGSNSGVMVRDAAPPDWYSGMEIQILDSFGKAVPDKHDCAALYDCLAPTKNTVKAPGEWNRMMITCKGQNIKVNLNGEDVLNADLNQWTEAHKNPDGTPNKFKKAYKDMPKSGVILLQGHGSAIWFRSIRVKEL